MKKLKLKKIDLSKFKIKKPKLNKINFSKYKLNKEKLQKKLPLAIGIILIITALAVFPNTLSRYASSGVSGTNINVAYSLLDVIQNDNGTYVDNVRLPEVNPDGNYNDFTFEIRNYKDVEENGVMTSKIINVKMRYYVTLTVTTNLPMTYYYEVHTHDGQDPDPSNPVSPHQITYNGTCSDTAGDNITTGLYCDAHHTYFYKFTFPLDISDPSKFLTMTYGQKQADTITLHYSLPDSFNTSAYQDIIELLSIKVHAEQYVKDK